MASDANSWMAAILDPVCGLWVTIGRLCVQFHIFPTLCVHKHATEIFSNDAANTTSFAQLHEALQYGDQKRREANLREASKHSLHALNPSSEASVECGESCRLDCGSSLRLLVFAASGAALGPPQYARTTQSPHSRMPAARWRGQWPLAATPMACRSCRQPDAHNRSQQSLRQWLRAPSAALLGRPQLRKGPENQGRPARSQRGLLSPLPSCRQTLFVLCWWATLP